MLINPLRYKEIDCTKFTTKIKFEDCYLYLCEPSIKDIILHVSKKERIILCHFYSLSKAKRAWHRLHSIPSISDFVTVIVDLRGTLPVLEYFKKEFENNGEYSEYISDRDNYINISKEYILKKGKSYNEISN